MRIEKKVRSLAVVLAKQYGPPPKGKKEDPLETLIVTILSQNTHDRNRDRAYESLKKKFPSWEAVLDAPEEVLARTIVVGGLSRQKANRIQGALRWVKDRFGKLDLASLRTLGSDKIIEMMGSLKGIGPKTLSCLLLFGLGREAFPVDTHILRVGKRMGFIPPDLDAEEAHPWMAPLVPKAKSLALHLHLIRFGRSICRARRPHCEVCFATKLCDAFFKPLRSTGGLRKS